MKISYSKKELARIISENGGWRDGADTCSCDNDGYVNFFVGKPTRNGVSWFDNGDCEYVGGMVTPKYEKIKNWHQTILSRDEYFFLYQNKALENALDEPMVEAKPTIEQLAADYRNAKAYAERKRQEADEAKADADAKLKALELAGEALGLLVSPIDEKQEPELVITDWRDLQVGDVIKVYGGFWEPDCEYVVDENDLSEDMPVKVGGYWAEIGSYRFEFIRRP